MTTRRRATTVELVQRHVRRAAPARTWSGLELLAAAIRLVTTGVRFTLSADRQSMRGRVRGWADTPIEIELRLAPKRSRRARRTS